MTLTLPLSRPGADDDEEEAEVEGGERRDGHAEVTERDDDAAVEHGRRWPISRSATQPPGSVACTPSTV
jgi:hypothetical protein